LQAEIALHLLHRKPEWQPTSSRTVAATGQTFVTTRVGTAPDSTPMCACPHHRGAAAGQHPRRRSIPRRLDARTGDGRRRFAAVVAAAVASVN
jgi:hypothetical protein